MYPSKTAIIFEDQKISFSDLNAEVNRIANAMIQRGIKKGDHVAVSCPNLPYFPMVYYAILKIGAVVVPLNILLKRHEIQYHLEDSDAKAYFCFLGTSELPMLQEGYAAYTEVDACEQFWAIVPPGEINPIQGAETLDQLVSDQSAAFTSVFTSPSDTAVILYTSGTTGRPKGAELTHNNLFVNAMTCQMMFRQTADDVHLITLPLFHSFGQTVHMNTGFLSGCTLVIIQKFDPVAILHAFQDHGVTVFAGVPTMYWGLLNTDTTGVDVNKISANLRLGVSGGAPMPVEVMRQFEEKFNITILESYGLSETSPVASFSRIEMRKIPGSIGVPLPGVEMIVADEEGKELPPGSIGEILIRGPNIMKGYYNRPDASAEAFRNGWFHSGDMGKMDENGYFYVVDRLKDMIIRGGYNVYPREVEELMMKNEKISLVAVVGEPDEKYGEEIVAYVVLKEGQSATEEELKAWAKANMADYKYPRKIIFKDQLPTGATGKILKRVL
ncbi:MAG: long-chain fatty acid--CoA ligase, partial [Gammaproteobacteria bacterium]